MFRVVRKSFSDRNISHFIILILLSVLAYLILLDVNWTLQNFGDDCQILGTIGKGKPSHSWVGVGRFWPLGLADYSILLLFSETPSIFHLFLFNAFIMVSSVLLLFHFLQRESGNWWISLFFSVTLIAVSSFLQIHIYLIYPERFIFFLQAVYMYFWWLGSKKQSLMCYFVAWVAITYSLFTKEPIFGMVFVIAFVNLFFGWCKLTEKDKIFHIAQLISSFFFIWFYLFVLANMGIGSNHMYAFAFECFKSSFSIMMSFFHQDPFLICIFLLAFIRAYMVLVKSDKRCLFSDSLLFGAIAYVMAYILLGFRHSYYIFPAIVFSLPSYAYWCGYFLRKRRSIACSIVICCSISVIPSIYQSYNYVLDVYKGRREDMAFVDKLIDLRLNGNKLYYFTKGVSLQSFTPSSRYLCACFYKAWREFLNYRKENRVPHLDDDILIPVENLYELPQHCVVICPQDVDQASKDYLKFGFHLMGSAIWTDVYKR
ncbi:MAG: hypothetical protein J6T29_01380 [Alphaproteobacteria bacterium]|nr:hypothetical protein [Alphaproteobacteria bacterium]